MFCPQLVSGNLNLSLNLNLSNAVFVLRRYDRLEEGNGISRASLCDNGNASEKRGLRLDVTGEAFSVIRAWQYRGRFWPQTHQDKLNFYYVSRGSLAETKSHLIYGLSVGYFHQVDLDPLLGLTDIIWKELNKLINSYASKLT